MSCKIYRVSEVQVSHFFKNQELVKFKLAFFSKNQELGKFKLAFFQNQKLAELELA